MGEDLYQGYRASVPGGQSRTACLILYCQAGTLSCLLGEGGHPRLSSCLV